MDEQNKLEIPYTEINEREHNAFYVSILKNLYAGSHSTLTALLQYVYQTHYFKAISPFTEQVLLDIATTEIKHLELLASAICSYGGDPQYISSRGMLYTTKAIEYGNDYVDMLLCDLSLEKILIKAYSDGISMVKDDMLIQFLNRLLLDEKYHYKQFENLLLKAKNLAI